MIGGTTFPPLQANVGSLSVAGNNPAIVLWCASARSLASTPLSAETVPTINQRTSSSVFFTGLKETITIRTNTSAAWRWRRIVFTHKGPIPGFTEADDPLRTFYQLADAQENLEYQRVATALPFALVADLYSYVFRGFGVNNVSAPARDWIDPITAPVDTMRIKVLYDQVTPIASGNDSGVVKTFNRWHPVRKNIMYGDQEIGGTLSTSPFSTQARPGIGDVYVMDLVFSNSEGEEDLLSWLPTSTVYWREK